MQSQFNIGYTVPPAQAVPTDPAGQAALMADLLRQILDVQHQQLAQLKATAAAHDASGRWRALLTRWRDDYPELPDALKATLPLLEKALGSIINQLVEELRDNEEALDTEFSLQDFVDRYGMRLGQLGNILNQVGPLVDAANTLQNETT